MDDQIETLQRSLVKAEETAVLLEVEYAQIDDKILLGEAGEEEKAKIEKKLNSAHGRVETLRKAITGAQDRKQQAIAEENERIRQRQVAELEAARQENIGIVGKFLGDRLKAADDLSTAMGMAVAAYQRIVALNEEALGYAPQVGGVPTAGILTPDAFDRAVRHEIFRLSADMIEQDRTTGARFTFPGGEYDMIANMNLPRNVKALADALREGGLMVIKMIQASANPTIVPVKPAYSPPAPLPRREGPRAEIEHVPPLASERTYADFTPGSSVGGPGRPVDPVPKKDKPEPPNNGKTTEWDPNAGFAAAGAKKHTLFGDGGGR